MAIRKILTRAIDSTASSSNLNIDANTLFIDATNNRVGIGSASPASKLVVNGASGAVALNVTNVSVDGSTADVVQIEPSNGAYYGKLLKITSGRSDYSDALLFLNTSTGMNGTNGSYLRVQNSSSADIFRIKGDGTVGIGVTAPANKLEVNGAIVATGAAAAYSAGMTIIDVGSGLSNITAIGSNTSTVGTTVFQSFSSNASVGGERMRIDSTGSLRIGNTGSGGTGPNGVGKFILNSDGYNMFMGGRFIGGDNASTYFTIGNWGDTSSEMRISTRGFTSFVTGATSESNGTERMRISSTGNVAIGTSETGVAKVNVQLAGTNVSGDTTGVSMGAGAIFQLNNSNGAQTNNTIMLLGGGTGSTAGQISSGIGFSRENENNWGTQLRFYTHNSATDVLSTLKERMRIDSTGNLLVNTTGNIFGSRLAVVGAYPQVAGSFESNNSTYAAISCYASQGNTPADQISFYQNVSSTVTLVGKITSTTNSVSYGSGSDYRLKNTITPMTGALAKVAQLKPVTFKWNVDESDGQGFIAHELQTVIPSAVSGEKDETDENGKPRYQTVDTSFLVATLTAAMQEQQVLIAQLQADVAALQAK